MTKEERTYLTPHFMLYAFTRTGITVDKPFVKNKPTKMQVACLEQLATYVLEPLAQHFGTIVISRAFMTRQVAYFNGIEPTADYCRGEACDIVCGDRNRAHFMYTFVRLNCEFQEMRFLPSPDNPQSLHISYAEGKNKCLADADVTIKQP